MRVLEAKAVISAADKTGNTFSVVAEKMRRMTRVAEETNRKAGMVTRASAQIATAGGRLGGVVGGAAGGFGAIDAYKRFADAEITIKRIGLTANATDAEIETLQGAMRKLAADTATPFKDVATGLAQLVSGGMELDKAKQSMAAIAVTARAAGAEVPDIANSWLALAQNFAIGTPRIQSAFDILVAGGKAGKFELKDMARYLPSIAPAAAAVGMKGEEGLKRVVAMLQAVREGTGTSEEAAASVQNIFAKMESEETAKRFKKFGVDLRKEMAEARKGGKDLLEVFTGLTEKAVGGDLSKIPQLFSDMEVARGMRPLLMFKDKLKDVMRDVNGAGGSSMRDFARTMNTADANIKNLANSFDQAMASGGKFLESLGASKDLQDFSSKLEDISKWLDRISGKDNDKLGIRKDSDLIGRLVSNVLGNAPVTDMPGADAAVENARRNLDLYKNSRSPYWLSRAADSSPNVAIAEERLQKTLIDRALLQLDLGHHSLGIPRNEDRALDFENGTWGYKSPAPLKKGMRRPGFSVPSVAELDDVSAAIEEARRGNSGAAAGVSGSAQLDVRVTVEPSPNFLSTVKSFLSGAINNLRFNGPTSGTTGSLGKSMPEAGQ